jgi:hypothetical protein
VKTLFLRDLPDNTTAEQREDVQDLLQSVDDFKLHLQFHIDNEKSHGDMLSDAETLTSDLEVIASKFTNTSRGPLLLLPDPGGIVEIPLTPKIDGREQSHLLDPRSQLIVEISDISDDGTDIGDVENQYSITVPVDGHTPSQDTLYNDEGNIKSCEGIESTKDLSITTNVSEELALDKASSMPTDWDIIESIDVSQSGQSKPDERFLSEFDQKKINELSDIDYKEKDGMQDDWSNSKSLSEADIIHVTSSVPANIDMTEDTWPTTTLHADLDDAVQKERLEEEDMTIFKSVLEEGNVEFNITHEAIWKEPEEDLGIIDLDVTQFVIEQEQCSLDDAFQRLSPGISDDDWDEVPQNELFKPLPFEKVDKETIYLLSESATRVESIVGSESDIKQDLPQAEYLSEIIGKQIFFFAI